MNYFSIVLLILTLIYGGFITWCLSGWRKLKTFNSSSTILRTRVSVILPARNEEYAIEGCLVDLLSQNYPQELFEVIVVDDHSTDRTAEVVRGVIVKFPRHRIRLLTNDDEQGNVLYKKQAIEKAIRTADGELIVTTDADCRMPGAWLSAIVSYYERENPDMIAAPVCFHSEKNSFEKIQCLEFIGLIGIGAGAISNKVAVMCNGANLTYTKKIFFEVNGFADNAATASGDDTQLMLKIAKRDSSKIHFLKSKDAIVYTNAAGSLNELIQQRKRWASKISAKMSLFTLVIAGVAWLLHAGLLMLFVASFFSHSVIPVFLFIFVLKSIFECIFLYHLVSFFNRKKLIWLLLPAQLIYMIYISVIGTVSPFTSYSWKGREIKSGTANLSA